jgi:uncharacterized RDD family membrane protein YckC
MSDETWFYRDGEGECGPSTRNDLGRLVSAGFVAASTPVRSAADATWQAASEVFPDLFAAAAPSAPGEWSDTSPHPWRRYFARMLDNTLVGSVSWFLIGILAYSVAPAEADAFFSGLSGPGGRLADIVLTLMAAIPGNALMIGLTGVSIGKWIFGVRVLRNGRPMGFARALRRESAVWVKGLGFGVPIVSFFTLLSAKSALEDRRTTSWDKAQDLTVSHRPESRGATILMWLGALVYVLVAVGLQILARA